MEWFKDKWKAIVEHGKNAWKSVTIWFNVILGTLYIFWPDITSNVSAVREFVSPELYTKLAIALAVGNVILRFKTTQALRDK